MYIFNIINNITAKKKEKKVILKYILFTLKVIKIC